MSLLFYDHLIDKTSIIILIESLDAPEEKKSKFRALADDILHTGLIEYILQKLHPHQHHAFLNHFQKAPYDPELINFLKNHLGDDVETQLQSEAHRLLSLIAKDLRPDVN